MNTFISIPLFEKLVDQNKGTADSSRSDEGQDAATRDAALRPLLLLLHLGTVTPVCVSKINDDVST